MLNPDPAAVRRWAREQGLVAAERGRLPRAVVEAYAAAHPAGPPRRDRQPRPPRQAAARRAPAGRKPSTAAEAPPPSARPPAAGAPQDEADARLAAVETQLAQALARLDALERTATRSVLGLRLSL